VRFADMTELGRNPNRIISAWQDFLAECGAGGRRVRGIAEPIWPGRSDEELIECERYELLLNLAFAGDCAWWLLCAYDAHALDPAVISQAHRSHPFVLDAHAHHHSASYVGIDVLTAQLDEHPLAEPAHPTDQFSFGPADLGAVRHATASYAVDAGMDRDRTEDLVLAVNELATNSLCHGGGSGILRVWQEGSTLVCEVRDAGHIEDPLAGHYRPAVDRPGGRGLWLVNQLCDLVQLRSSRSGTVVRLRARCE
jgi:anti-sigma regulatory factor (Ser/Thr protein kinase)